MASVSLRRPPGESGRGPPMNFNASPREMHICLAAEPDREAIRYRPVPEIGRSARTPSLSPIRGSPSRVHAKSATAWTKEGEWLRNRLIWYFDGDREIERAGRGRS